MGRVSTTIAVLAIALLAGCGEHPTQKIGDDTVDVSTAGNSAAVRMIRTSDGTRCAVMVGSERGGITCDWEGSRK